MHALFLLLLKLAPSLSFGFSLSCLSRRPRKSFKRQSVVFHGFGALGWQLFAESQSCVLSAMDLLHFDCICMDLKLGETILG